MLPVAISRSCWSLRSHCPHPKARLERTCKPLDLSTAASHIRSRCIFREKHAQQFLEVSGPVSEQAACHASARAMGLSTAPDVILSPCGALRVNSAKDLARLALRCFAALSMTAV